MLLPITEAAAVLQMSVPTMRRLIAKGMPVAASGSRGRGHSAMIDIAQAKEWIDSRKGPQAAQEGRGVDLDALAQVISRAMLELHRGDSGPSKRQNATVLAAAGYAAIMAVADALEVEPQPLPPEIIQLAAIGKS